MSDSQKDRSIFLPRGPCGTCARWTSIVLHDAHVHLADVGRAQAGVLEYTDRGDHQYHGAAVVEVDGEGHISSWREWQHRDDARSWHEFLAGPAE